MHRFRRCLCNVESLFKFDSVFGKWCGLQHYQSQGQQRIILNFSHTSFLNNFYSSLKVARLILTIYIVRQNIFMLISTFFLYIFYTNICFYDHLLHRSISLLFYNLYCISVFFFLMFFYSCWWPLGLCSLFVLICSSTEHLHGYEPVIGQKRGNNVIIVWLSRSLLNALLATKPFHGNNWLWVAASLLISEWKAELEG